MPRSYWLPFCVAVGLSLAIPIHAQPKSGADRRQVSATQGQNQAPEKPDAVMSPLIQSYIERVARAAEAANAHENAQQKSKYAADYLQTQRDMAANSGHMIWVAIADTGITFIGVLLVGGTLAAAWISARQATRAANEAKRSADATEKSVRAYLSIKTVSAQFFAKNTLVEILCVNTGQSPATDFVWYPAISFFGSDGINHTSSLLDAMPRNTGMDIRVGQEHYDRIAFPADGSADELVSTNKLADITRLVVHIHINFEYVDVFGHTIKDSALYAGGINHVPHGTMTGALGHINWTGNFTPLPKPRDE